MGQSGTARTRERWARGLRDEGRALVVALQFMTRLPLPAVAFRPALLARAALYFPAVGLVVGALGAAAYLLAALLWPPEVAAALTIMAMLLATGAFHEDGLADTADGLGGGWTVEDKLRIMRDSRIGSYGSLALVATLLLKFAVLGSLAPDTVPTALLLSQMLGRWSALPLVGVMPYVGGGSGRPLAEGVAPARIAAGTVFALLVAGVMAPQRWVALAALSVLAVAASGWLFRRQLGGITGDTLGAANQALELLVLLAFAVHD